MVFSESWDAVCVCKLFRLNFHLNRIFYIQIWKTSILLHDVYGFEMNFMTNMRPCFVGDFPFSCIRIECSRFCVVNMFRVIEPKNIHTHIFMGCFCKCARVCVCACERNGAIKRVSQQSQNRRQMMKSLTLGRFFITSYTILLPTQCKS